MDARKGCLDDLILPSPSYVLHRLPLDRIDKVCRALFAGFLSAFLIELGRFEPDPVDVLIHQAEMMRNSALGPYEPDRVLPSGIHCCCHSGVTLLAAAIAMLIKSSVREFDHGLQALSIPELRAATRESRYLGMEHRRLADTDISCSIRHWSCDSSFSYHCVLISHDHCHLSCWCSRLCNHHNDIRLCDLLALPFSSVARFGQNISRCACQALSRA